jgi:hypothetical protein
MASVLPGMYDLRVVAPGFRTYTRSNITLTINSVTREDVKLEVGQMTEQLSVVAEAVTLQTDKSDIRTEITGQTVRNMPLPAYRNYQSLIALVPGATPPAFQSAWWSRAVLPRAKEGLSSVTSFAKEPFTRRKNEKDRILLCRSSGMSNHCPDNFAAPCVRGGELYPPETHSAACYQKRRIAAVAIHNPHPALG